jgi:ketosteroid isomerase-like protein
MSDESNAPIPVEDRSGKSENLELVRSIYTRWERGDYSYADWADPEIEFAFADGPEPGHWRGLQAMADRYGRWLGGWKDFRAKPEEMIVVDPTRILVLVRNSGQGRLSGFEMQERSVANLFEFRNKRVTRLVIYWERQRALADLGLAG